MKSKAKLTRLCSILLTLVMVMGLLPTTVLAEGSAPAPATTTADFDTDPVAALAEGSAPTTTTTMADFVVDPDEALELLNDAKTGTAVSTWNSGTKTLTLNGVNFETTAATAVKLPAGSKIVLTDGTTNTIKGCGSNSDHCYGIYAKDSLTISGTGTLNVTSGATTYSERNSYGIYVMRSNIYTRGNLTISGSGTLNVTGGATTGSYSNSYGIYASNMVIIKGGIVSAQGGTATDRSYGICAYYEEIKISGGTVTAQGGAANYSYGIRTDGTEGYISVSGGTVNATGGTATDGSSYGICSYYGPIKISGGTVTAEGGAADDSLGIYAGGTLTISDDAEVTATGGEATNGGSYGIYVLRNLTIESGTVNATGGTATVTTGDARNCVSDGIYARSNLTIESGTVIAKGSHGYTSNGIFVNAGPAIIKSGTVTATGGTASISRGIGAMSVDIRGGTVTAKGDAAGESYGIHSNGIPSLDEYVGIKISGGTVTAEAKTSALDEEPSVLPDDYQWRTSKSGDYTQFSDSAYDWREDHTYLEIKEPEELEYTVTVTNGTASVSQAAAGTTVTLNANDASDGEVFDKWVVVSGGITLADENSAETTFTMPAGDVSVKATYKAAPHTHSYGSDWKSNADKHWKECTCGDKSEEAVHTAGDWKSNADKHWKECTCGAKSDEEAHTAGDWIIDTEATATTDGTKHKECDDCGYVMESDTIPATGSGEHTHSYGSDWKSNADKHWKECSCGDKSEEAAHTAGDWIIDTPATATTAGTKHKECTTCSYVMENGTIPATGSSGGGGGGSVSTYANTVDSAKNGAVTVSPKNAAKGTTVTITVKPDEGFELDTLKVVDKNGDEVKVTEKDGKYTFTMPASKVTVEATFAEIVAAPENPFEDVATPENPFEDVAAPENPFVDVTESAYYYDAVLWAAENGITSGVDDTNFAPNATCTRAQIVTFLWRAAGSPEPENMSSFADVSADSYYAKAVAWAVENGITDGTGDGMFSPDATCTRAQAMTFLWHAQKSPAADSVNPFTDVAADAYYNNAVLWAAENGITGGTSDTTFSPNDDCTRAQIVTFLWRALAE